MPTSAFSPDSGNFKIDSRQEMSKSMSRKLRLSIYNLNRAHILCMY